MIETFVTWDMLAVFGALANLVFMTVEYTKELKYVKSIHTKYYAWCVAALFIVLANIKFNTFNLFDLPLYALSAMAISLSANGLSNFNK